MVHPLEQISFVYNTNLYVIDIILFALHVES